jgi:hypothetical protein
VTLVYCPLNISANPTDQCSTIIKDRALLLSTKCEQQLVVDSVDRSEKGQ